MASDDTGVGAFTDLAGERFEVLAKPTGTVLIRGDMGNRILLGPQARDQLREYLDRAAMPGQAT